MNPAHRPRPTRLPARLASVCMLPLALLVGGCATSLPDHRVEIADSRRIEFVRAGHGSPAVIFEHGLGATLDSWAGVFAPVAADTTAFAYNRPGYGRSEPAATPRDAVHVVEELRGVLRAQGLHPPYVLVGHSLGGLYMQYFARAHPDEVQSLVLVDSTHPNQMRGKGAPEAWPLWLRLGFKVVIDAAGQQELAGVNASGDAVLALPPPTSSRVIVLSALQPLQDHSEIGEDANEKRRDILRLYPGARQVWVDSGHLIPTERPEAVVTAIREALGR